jgi:DNA-binding CsgD family transcriptional regulator
MAAEILGRERELAVVRGFLARVADGRSVLLLEGEPGIGKTALWQAALDEAARAGIRVRASRPSEAEAALPLVGLIDLLADVLGEALPFLPGPQAEALEIALLRAGPRAERVDQLALSVAVLGALTALARERPLLIAVDDLQWLDRPSARVLSFALRRLGEVSVALVASCRVGGDSGLLVDLERMLAEERVERLVVGPLPSGALDLLLRARLGLVLSPPRVRAVYERSGGNPLHALELGRLALAGASLGPGETLPVSATLSELVLERVGTVSESTREVLLEVAALSRPSLALVAERRAELEESYAVGLLERQGEQLRFSHPLYGSAIYQAATPEERRAVHRNLAERLSELEERALHLALAADGPDEGVAGLLEDTARRAAERGAPDAAAELVEQARRLTPPEAADDGLRRSLAAANFHALAGDAPRARTILETLVAELPPGRVRAEALLRLAEITTGFPAAVELCLSALPESAGDPGLEGRIHLVIGFASWLIGLPISVWEEHARAAAALAAEAGESRLHASALASLAVTRFAQGRGVARGLNEQVLALAPEGGLTVIDESAGTLLGFQLLYADELDEARTLLTAELERAVERGWLLLQVMALSKLVRLECLAGNFADAEEHLAALLEQARGLELSNVDALTLTDCALVGVYRGRVEHASRAADDAATAAHRVGDLHVQGFVDEIRGWLALSLGNAADADTFLSSAIELRRATGHLVLMFSMLPLQVEALLALGDLERARPLLTEATENAARTRRPRHQALAARCHALLHAAEGDTTGALACLEEAFAHHERLDNPFEFARTKLVEGTILRRAKRRGKARAALEQALHAFDELGTPLWGQRAQEQIARLGLRPAAGELTDTESKLANLVAAGRTNREVASELFISVKTVEANLTRIYRKLGVHSRTELARRIATNE